QQQLNQQNAAVVNNIAQPRLNQARMPDKFSGTNKNDTIENFKSRLDIYFLANPTAFKETKDKVLFIIQHLEGAAFAYIEPFISKIGTDDAPAMFASYNQLIKELMKIYGL